MIATTISTFLVVPILPTKLLAPSDRRAPSASAVLRFAAEIPYQDYARTISPTVRSAIFTVVLGFVCLLAVGSLVNGQIGFALLWAAVAGIAAYFRFVRGKDSGSDQQPGWYPNPTNLTEERYWNGRKWTDKRPAGSDRRAADETP